jgi:hypothetical protein
MNWWKATPVLLVLGLLALVSGCDSGTVAPDVDMAQPALSSQNSALSTVSGPQHNRGNGALGTIYVTSQGLYYDTFATADPLPPHGPFQLLVNDETEFGPGQPGYRGGRWKVPDGNGGYHYFLCPLLPPGREEP